MKLYFKFFIAAAAMLLASCGNIDSPTRDYGYADLDDIEIPHSPTTTTAAAVPAQAEVETKASADEWDDWDSRDDREYVTTAERVTVPDNTAYAAPQDHVWNFSGVSLTIPAAWTGRYEIKEDTLYVKKIYDQQLGKGALFHLVKTNSPVPDASYWYLLGVDHEGNYYFACTEEGVTYRQNEELNQEYDSMLFELESVLKTAVGEASMNDEPVDVSMYDNWVSQSTPLRGFWNTDGVDYEEEQSGVSIMFDVDSNRFGYFGYDESGEYSVGKLMFNRNSDSYSNNDWNDSDHGIVYLNGSVYKVRCTFGAVKTVSFECVMGGGSALTDSSFIYVDNYSDMYTGW